MNDLASRRPDLAAEWHPDKNGDLTPSEVSESSNRKVWWRRRCVVGQQDHEWEAVIHSRSSGRGCSVCAGKVVQVGINDLATVKPHLVVEWHPSKNGALTPAGVTAGSAKRVWWQCPQGHAWEAPPAARDRSGCPSCSPSGFTPADEGWLYLVVDENRGMMQVGITNQPKRRLTTHERNGWTVLDLRGPMAGDVAAMYERLGLRSLRLRGANVGLPGEGYKFDGFTESWSTSTLLLTSLRQLIEWVRDDDLTRTPAN